MIKKAERTIADMPELEEVRQSPKDIALAIFRFRARRGLGVFYTLLSVLSLLAFTLKIFAVPDLPSLVLVLALVAPILFVARSAGMKGFLRMTRTIDVYEGQQKPESPTHKRLNSLRRSLFLLPLILFIILVIYGQSTVALMLSFAWIASVASYNVYVYSKKSAHRLLHRHFEDWLVIAVMLIFLALSILKQTHSFLDLLVISPVFLLAGVKSLYEAPSSLFEALNNKDAVTDTATEPAGSTTTDEGDDTLSRLASAGALSSSARVGIMLALSGTERITFTDLMVAVKASRSSLSRSVEILEQAGYITISKGFKAAGGPRTFIQITKIGKQALKDHLETMQHVSTKYLQSK